MRIEEVAPGGNTISIIDVAARKRVGEISLGEFHRPHGIALDAATGRLAVSCELPDQLLIVDPVKKSVLRKYDTRGKTSHMVSFGRAGKWAYVSNSSSASVAAIELATGRVVVIPTGERPEGSVLSMDGGELYVANREGASISVIDTAKNAVTATIRTGNGPVRVALTPAGRELVYALIHDNKVEFADRAARKVLGQVDLKARPVSLNLSHDGKLAFAAAEDTDTVFVISVPERRIVRSFKTPAGMGPDPVFAPPRP
jgi:YVTN family beta-propeller protein